MIWLRALSFLVAVQIPAVVLLPVVLGRGGRVASPHVVTDGIGWFLVLSGALGILWCDLAFIWRGNGTAAPYAPTQRLVAYGLYRWTRNPIYVSAVIAVVGEAVLFRSGLILLYAGAMAASLAIYVRRFEEPRLRERFGVVFDQYCQQVPRWCALPSYGHRDRPPNER